MVGATLRLSRTKRACVSHAPFRYDFARQPATSTPPPQTPHDRPHRFLPRHFNRHPRGLLIAARCANISTMFHIMNTETSRYDTLGISPFFAANANRITPCSLNANSSVPCGRCCILAENHTRIRRIFRMRINHRVKHPANHPFKRRLPTLDNRLMNQLINLLNMLPVQTQYTSLAYPENTDTQTRCSPPQLPPPDSYQPPQSLPV